MQKLPVKFASETILCCIIWAGRVGELQHSTKKEKAVKMKLRIWIFFLLSSHPT